MRRAPNSARRRDPPAPRPPFKSRAEKEAFFRETAEAVAALPD
ncbi:MAG TPA: hypothetical protein VJ397_10930 [Thermoplasmata archaeon]|nr:hypothetical protein [Thermoplasmata archaeon]